MKILNTKEVARLLRTDKRSIQQKAKNGYYPSNVCAQHGRFYLFNEEALMRFLFKTNEQTTCIG